ncbi:MAG: twin-arginine translocase TatA/TatE family subunit [Acidimicrobiia bacterium]
MVRPERVVGYTADTKGITMLAFIKNIGGPELIIILVVVLLLFGAAKLPQLARSLGASAKEFKKGVEDGVSDEEADAEDSSV